MSTSVRGKGPGAIRGPWQDMVARDSPGHQVGGFESQECGEIALGERQKTRVRVKNWVTQFRELERNQ